MKHHSAFRYVRLPISRQTAPPTVPTPLSPPLTGTVTASDGAPVTGAQMSSFWSWETSGPNVLTPHAPFIINADGRFRIESRDLLTFIHVATYPMTLLVMDVSRKRGAVAVVRRAGEPVSLVMKPTAPVHFRLVAPPGLDNPSPQYAVILGQKDAIAVMQLPGAQDATVPLPPGEWELTILSDDTETKKVEFTVKDRARSVDLGRITLSPGKLARLYGKPAPPLTITDSLGASTKPSLDALKGQWVLVEFWSYWNPSCITYSLPEAIRVFDEFSDLRDQFAIFALHSADVRTAAELRPHLAELEKSAWHDRPLPFPILIDASKRTIESWGIVGFPSSVLIDPDGNMVRANGATRLRARLNDERQKRGNLPNP